MKPELLKPFRDLFLNSLETAARGINQDLDFVTSVVRIDDLPEGDKDSVFYGIYLECFLTDAASDRSDALCLSITVNNHHNAPLLYVDIAWGEPSYISEFEMFEETVEANQVNLAGVFDRLPSLVDILKRCLRENPRGMEKRTQTITW